ncbi:hypothetical protein QDR37_10405 [Amnibacterium sp. CER49]|uniref:HGxxPAAW family protein n=1 Tax=Amnibacterium sp. CER49 TaxID=3039161 RepID=UPI00244A4C84|nr:HGxxPAAW family protein [Amnibacterium sp. CER49]MDH2444353.1 hypothetical protein [Amnibacterium sp. CER49]
MANTANTSNDPGHGSSPAAWTAVVIMLVGFSIIAVFLFLDVTVMVYLGAILVPIGLIVGFVMKRIGLGAGGSRVGGSH